MKRLFDCVAAGAGLILASPVCAIAAILVRATSPGPILFRQERVGLDGKHFNIRKFRTMQIDHGGPSVSTASDHRITGVGRVLRKSKIDELPQLLDVLQGSMSLVGPRPEVPKYVDLWPAHLRDQILSVRPGITDPASIAYRNEADELEKAVEPERYYVDVILPRKVEMYAKYVREQSFASDLRILLATARSLGPANDRRKP
ncbi:sugar transferase [Paeniglutamicibacter gangotriensis]|uniref:Sugar transferase n=1 Tax=Paeniglutamicibacter gangotriensis Lz1y TaxID=1276920 RepID=M7NCK0_9MICC|nr:sugar transferase [Paeniglutamicibacter gangotriensis]EMQ99549.1 sugar transferase [Paeniglutamicibacter gangotriensis Lz1y]